jgi:tRNA 2-thiouridine synthesizing protein D
VLAFFFLEPPSQLLRRAVLWQTEAIVGDNGRRLESEAIMHLGIFLTGGPYQTQRWETAYHIAKAALDKLHEVTFFLFLDGVYNALGTQVFASIEKLPMDHFKELQSRGASIFACEVCSYNRGLDEGTDFYSGVNIVSAAFASILVSKCDHVLTL